VLVLRVVARDQFAARLLSPQRLRLAFDVVLDHGVRGVQDRLGRSVVLFERDDLGFRPVALEIEQVLDRRTAEGVDTLIRIADDEDVPPLPGYQRRPTSLRMVRVLELIDQDVLEAVLIVLAGIVETIEDLDAPHDQVVEVHSR
jgi:hypothetical protein